MSALKNLEEDNKILINLKKMKDDAEAKIKLDEKPIKRSFSEPSPIVTTNSEDLKHKGIARTETSGNYPEIP